MQRLGFGTGFAPLRGRGEGLADALNELSLLPRDLVRMDVKAFSQRGQRLVALQRGDRHLGLEGRRTIAV